MSSSKPFDGFEVPPRASPLPSEELNLLRPWIRKKFRVCGFQHLVAGVAFCALGLGTIALTSTITALVIFVLLTLFSFVGIPAEIPLETIVVASVFFIVLLSFWEAWRNPYGLGSFRRAVHLGDRVSGAMLGSSGSIIGDLFLGGPRMALAGINSFLECRQALRTNVDDAAAVLLWMFHRNRKAPAGQLSRAFPSVNLVILIPQLRLLGGFVWLSTGNGVCILGAELKSEMRNLLQLEPESRSEPEPEPPQQESPLSEEQQWFATLQVDAYASLAEVKRRYRMLARQFHPDYHRNGSLEAQQAAEERMKAINEAYQNVCRRFAGA